MDTTSLTQAPSTNGHDLKTAIPYYRVSGDRQRDHGYSLDDQRDALRSWCQENGYTILEEVEDGAQSGGDLMRPGLDRVRELVKAGGVDAVVVLFRDRLARGVYAQLLSEEFAEHGTRLIALNAQGIDDSPEGELQGGILDVISGWERRKIAERTRRGRLAKARKGFVVAGRRPPHGFDYTPDRNNYVVDPEKMASVRRIFELVGVEGVSIYAARAALEREGHDPPESRRWTRHAVRNVVMDDCYRPHTNAELAALVEEGLLAPDVFARLDRERSYGIAWFNRTKRVRRKEPLPAGGYRERSQTVERPREEWIAVAVVDANIPREWVDAAREAIRENRVPARAGNRIGELSGGIFYCSGCGRRMVLYTTRAGRNRKTYRYYVCPARRAAGEEACYAPVRSVNADKIERQVWEAVSVAHRESTREDMLTAHFDSPADILRRMAEDVKIAGKLAEHLQKLEARRSAYIDLAADGTITRDDLRSKLATLDEERRTVRQQMAQIVDTQEARRRLLSQRDALVEHIRASIRFEHPAERGPEDRHKLYRDLGLRVELDDEGNPIISGTFGMSSNVESSS